MSTIRKVLDLLTNKERRQLWLLIPVVILMALAEVAGIASIAPFLGLVSDPDAARTNPLLSWVYTSFGFESDRSFLIAIGLGVVFALLAANAILAGGHYALIRFGSMRNYSISRRLLIRYLQQPYTFFLTKNSSALANNILQEVTQIIIGVINPGLLMIAKGAAAIAIVVLLVALDPLLAVSVTVGLGGAYAVVFQLTRRYLKRAGTDRVLANQARYRAANEAMGSIKELRLGGREAEMVRRFSGPARKLAWYQVNSRVISTLPRFVLEAVAFGSIVVMVIVLLSSDRTFGAIVPVLGLYAFAGYRLLPALQQVFSSATAIRYSTGALDEVHAMVRRVDAHEPTGEEFPDPHATPPIAFEQRLSLDHVTFTYDETSTPAIRSVTLEIPARASVAFVGATGAGKSTIVDLILGLLPADSGRILVDDLVLDDRTIPSWQRRIGYVPQAIFLTDDSISRNIALGIPDEDIDHAAVRRAARMAQIDTFIEGELREGYDTIVGERGVRLSGGQRQRIGIARALYHDPDVLVFDEATSALDGSTERALQNAILTLSGRKTLITIAHRLSTVRDVDRIFVMEQGEVTARGSYDTLLQESEAFRAMVDAGTVTPASVGSTGDRAT